MNAQQEAAMFRLKPFITEAAGLNIFSYPGSRDEFIDNLVNMGISECVIKFALRFQESMINLDMLFYLIDVIKTTDGAVIFYSPESRVLEMKLIMRP